MEQKHINVIRTCLKTMRAFSVDEKLVKDCEETMKVFDSEMGKMVAKQPIETQELIDIEWLCPSCKKTVGYYEEVDNYCRSCGQKILFN